ncbi:MAG: MBL fold metallo-hydrolase [Alphaproteobacteria bacterium]
MQTRIDEIASGIYRLSTHVAEIAPPAGFSFNQFLVVGDDALLFHTGPRGMLAPVSAAVRRLIPLSRLRWIGFSHYEADECGAMNDWLALAPRAEIAHGALGCMVTLNDAANRPPRPLADSEVIDLGGPRLRYLDTPHVPHGWDAGLMFEESSGTLLCSDLFSHVGDGPPVTEGDIVGPAMAAEAMFQSSSLHPATGATIRRLAALKPATLAVMHGASFAGDGAGALSALAAYYDERRLELAA